MVAVIAGTVAGTVMVAIAGLLYARRVRPTTNSAQAKAAKPEPQTVILRAIEAVQEVQLPASPATSDSGRTGSKRKSKRRAHQRRDESRLMAASGRGELAKRISGEPGGSKQEAGAGPGAGRAVVITDGDIRITSVRGASSHGPLKSSTAHPGMVSTDSCRAPCAWVLVKCSGDPLCASVVVAQARPLQPWALRGAALASEMHRVVVFVHTGLGTFYCCRRLVCNCVLPVPQRVESLLWLWWPFVMPFVLTCTACCLG